MGGESIYGRASKTKFSKELYNIRWSPFDGKMLDQTQMAANSLLYKINIFHIRKGMVRGAWLKNPQKSIRQKWGTPHLDQRHTVFGQLMDEASFLCWMNRGC